MWSAIANFLGVDPGLLLVLVIVGALAVGFFLLTYTGGISYPTYRDEEANKHVRKLMDAAFIKKTEDEYKALGRTVAQGQIAGGGYGWVIPSLLVLVILVGMVYSGLSYVGVNFSFNKTVKKEFTCSRVTSEGWVFLQVGEKLQNGDVCKGKIVQVSGTQVPAPAQLDLPPADSEVENTSPEMVAVDPPLAQERYYAAWVRQNSEYWAGSWNVNSNEGMNLINGKTERHACGEWVTFSQENVMAIVFTSEPAPLATIEFSPDALSVRVNCNYPGGVEYYVP